MVGTVFQDQANGPAGISKGVDCPDHEECPEGEAAVRKENGIPRSVGMGRVWPERVEMPISTSLQSVTEVEAAGQVVSPSTADV